MVRAEQVTGRQLIEMTLDPGTFTSWDEPLNALAIEEPYRDELVAARESSEHDESILTGEGLIDGLRVAVIVGEFSFLGGSIGVNAAGRIAAALERATRQALPVLAAPVSGGTRMQEGTIAFLQMIKITEAVGSHKAAKLPYLVYLRHPTTGGVFASWGSLGHVTVAQTGALIGFLGPKVYRALHGEDFPSGVQTAENLFQHGLVDAVLDPARLRMMAASALHVMGTASSIATAEVASTALTVSNISEADAWKSVELSRRPGRPGLRSLLRYASSRTVPLSGTGQGESNTTSQIALATFGGRGVVVVGLDRRARGVASELGPGALRQARRGMSLASELGMPLITVIDTPGAALSKEAEEGGLGAEIARSLADLIDLDVPTVAVILGEGTGGGALALIPADRIVSASNGWLAPLPPEGASVIRFGDSNHGREMAIDQRVSASDLFLAGIVDEIVQEPADLAAAPADFCRAIGHAVERQLDELFRLDPWRRRAQRSMKYRDAGTASRPPQ